MIAFALVMVGIVLPLCVVVASVISARESIKDRNAAHRALRGAYAQAGAVPPSGL